MGFGDIVVEARKKQGLTQKQLAALLVKEDGQPISPQYLHDIEKGRRNPPSGSLMVQLARRLRLPADYLQFAAGQLPDDLRNRRYQPGDVQRAFQAMRAALTSEGQHVGQATTAFAGHRGAPKDAKKSIATRFDGGRSRRS